jgi:hypothetical protein
MSSSTDRKSKLQIVRILAGVALVMLAFNLFLTRPIGSIELFGILVLLCLGTLLTLTAFETDDGSLITLENLMATSKMIFLGLVLMAVAGVILGLLIHFGVE